VNEFIDRLTVKRQVAIDNEVDRLNMLSPWSPHLPFPNSSQIEGELRELRCHFGRELYRILYRRSRNLIAHAHLSARTPPGYRQLRSRSPRSDGGTSGREWMLRGAGHHGRRAAMHPSAGLVKAYQKW